MLNIELVVLLSGIFFSIIDSNIYIVDRSWARRARGVGPRKRPDLLSADFSGERERPTSPSPLAEDRTFLQPPEPEEKPK